MPRCTRLALRFGKQGTFGQTEARWNVSKQLLESLLPFQGRSLVFPGGRLVLADAGRIPRVCLVSRARRVSKDVPCFPRRRAYRVIISGSICAAPHASTTTTKARVAPISQVQQLSVNLARHYPAKFWENVWE